MAPFALLHPVARLTWSQFSVHPSTVVRILALGALYIWRTNVARKQKHSEQRSGSAATAFAAGLVVLFLSLNGPLHDLSDFYLFSAHMVQHLLLTLVVPPLLLGGTPAWMIDTRLGVLLRWPGSRRAAGAVTRPVPALALYAVALVGWHLPGPYGVALERHAWHVVEHLALIVTATLGWWPVLSPSRQLARLHYGPQILYLFAFGIPMTAVAAMITGAEHVLYPFYAAAPGAWDLSPLADQRLGALIMWA